MQFVRKDEAVESTVPVYLEQRRDWGVAFQAIKKLMADGQDTAQVFRIMRALNAGAAKKNYEKMASTVTGGRIAFERGELVAQLASSSCVAAFAPGTVGAAYRDWLGATGFSADGLADISKLDRSDDGNHPYAWMSRRSRDLHDLWHVLTGYKAEEDFGEICLVAFSYAQTGGLGWAFIASISTLKFLSKSYGRAYAAAVWEAYRMGRNAKWLLGEDYAQVLNEPLSVARARLNLRTPTKYLAIRETVSAIDA